jgi:hypothetical protein
MSTDEKILLEKYEDGFFDKDNCHWDNPKQWLFSGILGGCFCGYSESLSEMAFEVLDYFSKFEKDFDWFYKNKEFEVIAHWFNSKELIEHGSGIGGSWLTDYGYQVYNTIKKYEG